MKINQLFKDKIGDELALKVVRSFGLTGMDDTSLFCKNDIVKHDSIRVINSIKDELEQYYLPCKAKCYLTAIDAKKCITLLRQILRLFGLKLQTRQKYVQSRKMTFYNIVKEDKTSEYTGTLRVNNEQHTMVVFD
jgi:hypothetical protein